MTLSQKLLFSGARAIYGGYESGALEQPILLYGVHCRGSEISLSNCPSKPAPEFCKHQHDAGVICIGGQCL